MSSALGLIPIALALLAGCAGNSDALEKRLASMRDDIRRLQNDEDRANERLEAVELRQAHADAASARPAAQANAGTVTRPRLKVLHLAPDGEARDDQPSPDQPATDDGNSRTILRGQGKELEIKNSVSQNEGPSPGSGAK
ncbi:MAG TPA: hypothetical protein VGP93_03705 [Polyangiaceae bacterium]|nr:hypothetical protein [Polyangiaceae bacterium]